MKSDSIISDILRLIVAFFCPPLAMFTQVGFGKHFWISLVLVGFFYVGALTPFYFIFKTIFYFPALIHAVIIIMHVDVGYRGEKLKEKTK